LYFQNKNLTHEKLPIFFIQNNYKFKGKKVTKNNMIDVTTIGNAIVDIIAQCSDSYLIEQNIIKSSMNLIDEERSKSLYENLEKPKIISGGSAANTSVGISSLGSNTAFIGKVKNDELGQTFKNDIEKVGVLFNTPFSDFGPRTASSIILVTPDAERSMNTFLGACVNLDINDVDESLIKNSKIVYLEGYLFDPPKAKEAFVKTAKIAQKEQNLVAMTLSDSFCVERHRSDFISFTKNHVDILFANDDEIKNLFQCDLKEAKSNIEEMGTETIITLGPKGSVIYKDKKWTNVDAIIPERIMDTTGAGDLYASGYLHGRSLNLNVEKCGMIGSIVASEIISHIGPRPIKNLKELIQNI